MLYWVCETVQSLEDEVKRHESWLHIIDVVESREELIVYLNSNEMV